MPEVPKIVHDRLRAGLPGGAAPEPAHPDPDVLTAFAEQALTAAEREGVLQHLARCGECRQLVALSVPPVESAPRPAAAEESELAVSAAGNARGKSGGQRAWFTWPTLRWAALAAGIVVAGGILLIHPGKPNAVPEAKHEPTSTVVQPEEAIVAKKTAPAPAGAVNTTDLEKKGVPAKQAFRRDNESKLAYPAATPPDKAIARGAFEARMANKDVVAGAATGAAVGAAPTSPAPAPPVPAASQMVEVTSESAAVTTEEARNELPVTGRNVAAPVINSQAQAARSELPVTGRQVAAPMIISRAKAAKTEPNAPSALQPSEDLDKQQTTDTASRQPPAAANANSMASNLRSDAEKGESPQSMEHPAQWALHGNDVQRSLDSGSAWKTVLHSDRPLLCYATNGNEIWVGGKGGDLFHSANGGLAWNRVHPWAQEQTLSDDVTNIDIYNSSHIVLSTSNHQTWSTSDGGKSWEKK